MENKVVLILGSNASGKTVILKNDLEECLRQGRVCVTNINTRMAMVSATTKEVDIDLINIVNDGLDYSELIATKSSVAVKVKVKGADLDEESRFLDEMMTIVMKRCDCIFLDEPESLLSSKEIGFLCRCLNYVSPYRFIEYTTHNREMTGCIPDEDYYAVKEGTGFVKKSLGDDMSYGDFI